jgi:hypothetical protein
MRSASCAASIILGLVCVTAFGCNAVLDLGSLSERAPDAATLDATRRDGSGSGSSGREDAKGRDARDRDAEMAHEGDASRGEASIGHDARPDASTQEAAADANTDAAPECEIGGSAYGAGAANPMNACQTCEPTTSSTAWSSVSDGTGCGDGGAELCVGGACASGCEIGGTFFASGAPEMNNPCQVCAPSKSTTAWSNAADGTGCGNGQICSAGACGTQCDIDGTVYASGTMNPSNSCESCQPGTSTTAWTLLATGTPCGAGTVCNNGSCTSDCYIGGTIYVSGEANPGNPCQSCQPSTLTTGWSATNNGGACGVTGETCSSGTCTCVGPATLCTTCTNTGTDDSNCGGCGRSCSTVHASSTACSAGVCIPTCASGYQSCSNPSAPTADNGCECVGTGCCGNGCQTQHTNGVGNTFVDCNPAATHDQMTAEEACEAVPGATVASCTTGCNSASTIFLLLNGTAYIWFFDPNATTGNVRYGPWTVMSGACNGEFTNEMSTLAAWN